jgi:hypothetical protein
VESAAQTAHLNTKRRAARIAFSPTSSKGTPR